MDELERYTQARIGGNHPAENTGKFIAAKFEHDTARPVDGYAAPQLHTHAVIFNVTERADGTPRAVQPQGLFDSQNFATAVYQSELTHRLTRLGYEIEPGRSGAPELKGYAPAAVVETSPGSFQAWLRHKQPLSKELGTLAAKALAEQFGADRSAADWRRFGRAPGFTNRKPQHRSGQGLYPFARLHSYTGQPFAEAATFHATIVNLRRTVEEERTAVRRSFATRPLRFLAPVSLARFRTSQRYLDRPAAADMAFCIAACSQGWAVPDIAAELARCHLSRDTNRDRKAAYIKRTVTKALLWAA